MKTQTNTATVHRKAGTGTHRQPEQTRAAILDAALREFALEGIEGARTESIAQTAGVNKALLYYYFRDKENYSNICSYIAPFK
jgi:TetR/AcrR family transcriptional regulator